MIFLRRSESMTVRTIATTVAAPSILEYTMSETNTPEWHLVIG